MGILFWEKSEEYKFKNKVLHYLKYRLRSEKEIRDHFRDKIPASILEAIIKELKERRFVDDRNFALLFAQEKLRNGWGRKALRFELFKKGVNKDIVDDVISGISLNKEKEIASNLVKKKVKGACPLERKKKIYQILCRRGFPHNIIEKVLNDEDF